MYSTQVFVKQSDNIEMQWILQEIGTCLVKIEPLVVVKKDHKTHKVCLQDTAFLQMTWGILRCIVTRGLALLVCAKQDTEYHVNRRVRRM